MIMQLNQELTDSKTETERNGNGYKQNLVKNNGHNGGNSTPVFKPIWVRFTS
jgi:hypothetical protein